VVPMPTLPVVGAIYMPFAPLDWRSSAPTSLRTVALFDPPSVERPEEFKKSASWFWPSFFRRNMLYAFEPLCSFRSAPTSPFVAAETCSRFRGLVVPMPT
jgi:hypothetical protein